MSKSSLENLETQKSSALVDVIKYEGDNDIIVRKYPIEDFNLGSQLIVHESQEAVFFRDGQALDLFGAGRYTLETQKLPLLDKLYKLPTGSAEPFHSEVYFINKVVQTAINWGTPEKVRFIDPLTGVPLELGVSGEMNFQVSDSRRLLVKLVGTMKGIAWESGEGMAKSLQVAFRPLITSAVKTNLSAVIKDNNIDILEIDEKLDIISNSLHEKIVTVFEEYGLTIPQFYVTNIVLPEDDANFKRIRELHTITLQTRIIQAEATVKSAEEQSKAAIEAAHRQAVLEQQTTETEVARREAERKVIEAQAEAQASRMAGLTEAEIMAAKGYTQKDVLQAEVQKAYAEGIGKMGPDTVSGGSTGGIVGDMMQMGVGMAAMNAMAPQFSNMMKGFGGNNQSDFSNAEKPSGRTCANCGKTNIISNFCPDCGAKILAVPSAWNCPDCGKVNITSNFCPECGRKKDE